MQVDRASGDGLPTLHMDYFYLSSANSEDEDVMPHLVVRCDKTRRTWATALPQKGVHAFNVDWLCSIVREAGWKKMILFSDNEPAKKALKQAVVEAMTDLELNLQESPTSANQENAASNGTAESAVREVKRMIRAILSELETKTGQKFNADHHLLAWIARHAAFLLTRFRIGEDGKARTNERLDGNGGDQLSSIRRTNPVQASWSRRSKAIIATRSKGGNGSLCWHGKPECRLAGHDSNRSFERPFVTQKSRTRPLVDRRT